MRINLFAGLAHAYGRDSVAVDEDLATVRDAVSYLLEAGSPGLRKELLQLLGEWPAAGRRPAGSGLSILLNGRNVEFLDGLDTVLGPGDVVTLIPPAAGG
ncbi:MAG: MoaD/ThiS family protein [Ignavibacteriales bacterium]